MDFNDENPALRNLFYKETNIAPVFAKKSLYWQYIEFLENKIMKITDVLNEDYSNDEKIKDITTIINKKDV